MKQIKFYSKQVLIFIGSLLIFTTLLSIFQYFNILSFNLSHTLLWIFQILLLFILGIISGKNATSKGYLEGLKLSGILLLILLLLNIIFFQSPFSIARILYYMILIIICIAGAMIGINKKKK